MNLERAQTEVRIGNHGIPLAYINTANESLVRSALNEFKTGLFDVKGVQRYFNIQGKACLMDSLRLLGCGIYAGLAYARDNEDYLSEWFEHILRQGPLFLGADIEFDTRKTISAAALGYDKVQMEAMVVGEQMTYIKFKMLYVWDKQNNRRDVVYLTH